MDEAAAAIPNDKGPRWKWWVSGILLVATMLNYMDRQTLANLSVRITEELSLSQERYGDLELAFGWAFAAGSLCFGILADRLPVRWLYPAVVIGWSVAGMLTGLCSGFWQLLGCRTLLGFFEAGHWPCALRTTQSVLSREERTLGNSLLQSGGAAGAVITPLLIRSIVGDDLSPGAWRPPFLIIGAVGAAWVAMWLVSMGTADLRPRDDGPEAGADAEPPTGRPAWGTWWDTCLGNRRFWALVPFVVCINSAWHLLRVWLPKFLQQGRGASEAESLYFNSAYYVSADVGCIAAGAASLWLVTRGLAVHRARLAVVAVCAACTAAAWVATSLPRGPAMYAALLVAGAGAMGLFPCYYSLAQEVSPGNVGRATGLLAMIGWLLSSPLQKAFGRLVDRSGSFDAGLAWAGFAPLAASAVLLLAWPREHSQERMKR